MRRLKPALAPLFAFALCIFPNCALGTAYHPFLQAGEPVYEDACGVALHGGLWVSSYYQDKVLMPSGQISPESQGSGPCKIELDAAGDLYVNDWHEKVVKYSSSELLPGYGMVVDSDNPTGLAVEQATGDLYVAHRTYISKYSPTGALLEEIGGSGELQEAYGVAVSEYPATLGDLYVPDAATKTVKIFGPGGAPLGEMNGANTPQGHFTYFKDGEIVVDNSPDSPSYGHIYVLDAVGHGLSAHPAAVFDEFNAQGAYRGQIGGFIDAEPSGIAIEGLPGLKSGDLTISSGNSEDSQVLEFGPTSRARTLTLMREGSGHGTVTSSPRAIACGSYCSAEFNEGQTVSLFPIPDAHSTFLGWTVSGSEPCPGTGSCTVLMAKNVEVKAVFAEPAQEALTVSTSGDGTVTSTEGISCPSACTEHFAEGRVVSLKAIPGLHQRLASWSGCAVQANPLECKVTMSEEKAVSVTFEAIGQLPLGVSVTGPGQGTVTSYPSAISCPDSCSSSFDEDSTVYLMAAPSPGSGFAGFSGGGCSGSATLCAVPMSSAQSVTATFSGSPAGPSPAAMAAAAGLKIASIRTGPSGALVSVKTSEAGTLFASGGGIKALKRGVSAGTTTLALRLGPAARAHLKRRGRLALRLSMGFIPASGTLTSRALRLSFTHRDSKALRGQR